MKINHFPNISLDISETKEKYLTEKNEEIIEELCQILVEHSKIESDIFLKHQEINTYKKENNLPTHQTIPGEMELFDEFKLVQCEFDLSLIKDQEQLEQLIIYLGDHLDQETLVIHNRMMQIYELLEECSVYKLAITKKKLPIIKQIVTYIEQHYDDELSLTILANHFHFS